jgi:cytochrome c-type biogenesis protein CcmH
MKRMLLAWLLMALALAVQAKEAAPMAEDEAIEQRLVVIAEELRCLVCQNESLAGSHAELAQDLRREIRTLLRQGKTDAEVMDFLVNRYGDFVRYRPPFKPTTWLLWGGPLLLLLLGAGVLAYNVRRRPKIDADLSRAERERAAQLLELP